MAHVALNSRPDIAYHAVELARQLVRPSEEASKFADEVMQYLFSTANRKRLKTKQSAAKIKSKLR